MTLTRQCLDSDWLIATIGWPAPTSTLRYFFVVVWPFGNVWYPIICVYRCMHTRYPAMQNVSNVILKISWWFGLVVRGESPGCRLISTDSMLEWLRNLLPHHSQGSSTERWSRNTLRVVNARVFYVLRGFLTSPFILNNSVETAAPFNEVSHPRCSEPRN